MQVRDPNQESAAAVRQQPRLWASAHGLQACLAHGMKHEDYYLADAERIVRHRGRRGATVEVVGDLPASFDFCMEWQMADFVPYYHDPDWRRDDGPCRRCLDSAEPLD